MGVIHLHIPIIYSLILATRYTVGIYKPNGTAHSMLVKKILRNVDPKDILWEAPQKAQQVWFIKLCGTNVNLGNIAPNEVIPLETIRLGLRGDTFSHFL